MIPIKPIDALRKSTLLETAPEEVLRKVADLAVPMSIPAGTTLFEKGEPGQAMYIIADGQVRVHDQDLVLARLRTGDILGEMAALDAGEVRSASITADEDTHLLRLDRVAVYELLTREPEVAKALIHMLCQREKKIITEVTQRSLEVQILEHELEIGRQIQAGFLPDELPEVPGWEIAAHFEAAREVAGDFYDVFEIHALGNIGLVIGDVCGKGIGAALFMTLFRSLIRATSVSGNFMNWANSEGDNSRTPDTEQPRDCRQTLSSAVSLTNNYISHTHDQASMFASLFFGMLDPVTGNLLYINAGHEAPVIFNHSGIRQRLKPTGPVVGIFQGAEYAIGQAQLDEGDSFIAFTDGVTEATNPGSDQFTELRLLTLLEQGPWSASELLVQINAKLREFASGAAQFDDITLLAVSSTLRQDKTRQHL